MSANTGNYASVNGLRVYYEVHGDGRPLVLLHGGVTTIELTFGDLVASFAEHHKVIAIELQGHGRTADTDREMSLPALAEDVVTLLGQLDIDQAHFFGFSLGALVSFTIAIRYPNVVYKLVLASANYRPDGYDSEARDTYPAEVERRMPTPADFQQMRDMYEAVAPHPEHFDALAEKTSTMVRSFPGFELDALRTITAPTLLVFGDTDFTPLRNAVEMLELIPNAQLAVLPGTTHMGVTRSGERLRALIEPFLGEGDGHP